MFGKKSKKDKEKEMPFLEHLEELRWRLVRSIVAIFIASALSFLFKELIFDFLIAPFNAAIEMHTTGDAADEIKQNAKLISLAPVEFFMVYIKLALFAGLFLSSPYVFYQLWKFIAPGLLEKEKKYVPYFVTISTFFFFLGAIFCYVFVLKYGLYFLLDLQRPNVEANYAIREYLKFVTMLILVFGVFFEMPILTFFLTKLGVLTPKFMRQKRRYGIVTIFILASILTPPDPFTQIILAVPLLILYEASILVSKFTISKEEQKVAAESAA